MKPGHDDAAGTLTMLYDPYRLDESTGVMIPPEPVEHREDEYGTQGHDVLAAMQRDHFWYRGRHRFLLHAVKKWALPRFPRTSSPRVIDLGGGCGGWVRYLADSSPWLAPEFAMSDSSTHALELAAQTLPPQTRLYQTDLLNLQWTDRWDCAFLLDVLEHIPDHEAALRQIHQAMAPGGLLFLMVPALEAFWSYADEVAYHQRRYSVADFTTLVPSTGWKLLDCRYFMFFLSPLLWVSRSLLARKAERLTFNERLKLAHNAANVPPYLLNHGLAAIFAGETPLGHHLKFPWGTSVLAVIQKAAV